jgi:tetratricopeptide (TPR) repeat protein
MVPIRERLRALSAEERDQYERLAEQFEEAWLKRPAQPPDIEPLLPMPEPLRTLVLVQLAKCDLEARRRLDAAARVESYVERFAELRGDSAARAELVSWEYQLRDNDVTPQEYISRFPDLGEQLHGRLPPRKSAPIAQLPEGYTLVRELRGGGMGLVFLVANPRLGREEVLKILDPRLINNPPAQERFRREARAAGQLKHPHIVTVYAVEESPTGPYFLMEYCRGGSLAERLRTGPLEPAEAARLLSAVARGTYAAHQAGIIHRDLKPGNILFADEARTVAKVSDFGLARRLEGTAGLTQTGQVFGTPGYMAPEQARGDTKDAGPACDIWSLGAVLYECLTGRPPFTEATPLAVLLRALHEDPIPPGRLARIPRDLEVICLKCLRKEPGRRYSSAAALAEDLERFVAGKPITARPPGMWERLMYWSRREPRVAALSAAVVLLLAAGVLVATWLAMRERRRAEEAEQARRRADDNARLLGDTLDGVVGRIAENRALQAAGLTDLRNNLLHQVVPAYERLLAANEGVSTAGLGRALNSMAGLRHALGQEPEALADARLAEDLFDGLGAGLEARFGLATARMQAGRLLAAQRQFKEGLAKTLSALPLLEELCQADPDNAEYRFRLMLCANNAANFRLVLAPDRAPDGYREALEHLAELRRRHPDEVRYQEWEARTCSNLGLALPNLGRLPEAADCQTAAVRLADALVASQPGNVEFRDCLATTLANLAEVLARLGRLSEAEAGMRRTLEQYQLLAARCPTDLEYRWGTALARTNLAAVLADRGRLPQAEKELSAARHVYEALMKEAPKHGELAGNFGTHLTLSGRVQFRLGKTAQACAALERAAEVLKPYREDPDVARQLGELHTALGSMRPRDAGVGMLQQARTELAGLVESAAQVPGCRLALADADLQLGRALLRQGKAVDAEQSITSASKRLADLAREQPYEYAVRRKEAECCCAQAALAAQRAGVGDDALKASLSWLREAEKRGQFANAAAIEELAADPDFAPVRLRPAFAEYLGHLRIVAEKGAD